MEQIILHDGVTGLDNEAVHFNLSKLGDERLSLHIARIRVYFHLFRSVYHYWYLLTIFVRHVIVVAFNFLCVYSNI